MVDYLPFSLRGSILFTTRNLKAAVKLAGKHIITVETMTETESLELLKTSLTRKELTTNRESTTRLLELLTNLPLAIKQASAYMNENQISTTKYLEIYQSDDDELIYLLSKDFEDRGRYKNVKNPIATTWLISFCQILNCDSLAVDCLRQRKPSKQRLTCSVDCCFWSASLMPQDEANPRSGQHPKIIRDLFACDALQFCKPLQDPSRHLASHASRARRCIVDCRPSNIS